MATTKDLAGEPEALRVSMRQKYREMALQPDRPRHFHTGRPLATMLADRAHRSWSARPRTETTY